MKNINHLQQAKTLLYSISVLALGMGLGRFLYTAMFPLMLSDYIFGFEQLSYIASINYIGYLMGALLFSFSLFHRAQYLRYLLLSCAITTVLYLFGMVLSTSFFVIASVRLLAGISSAGLIIFGSISILKSTQNRFIIASFYSGVGTGILLGNEYVNIGLLFNLSVNGLWIGSGVIAALLLFPIVFLQPKGSDRSHAQCTNTVMITIPWYYLVLLYGFAGFGYIITATYLPVIAQDLQDSFVSQHLWSMVGVGAIVSCYFWIYIEKKFGLRTALMTNLVSQSLFVVLTLFSESALLLSISAVGVGMTFMGTTTLVMPIARKLKAPTGVNLVGLVTLTYGVGQALGPIVATAIHERTHSLSMAIIAAAIGLFIAAIIVVVSSKQSSLH